MSEFIKDFYVVSIITNPERYKRRPQLFKEYMNHMAKYNAQLYVVEGAFGDRDYEVTDPENPRHIRVQLDSELWHKENLVNIGISRLPSTWKYVAWIDGDIDFVRADWILETVHELQHHPIVQLFEDAIDLGPNHEILKTYKSFAYCYKNNLPQKKIGPNDFEGTDYCYGNRTSPATYWHPGYAWAATRDAINTIGGLFDTAIVGAGDHHMACCLIGNAQRSIPSGLHPNYKKSVFAWQERALRLHKNIGYIKGSIYHYWHGKKKDRKYKDRWQILIDNKYNPFADIHKDWQGVWTLYPGHEKLRDQIRDYFQARNEDSIDKE